MTAYDEYAQRFRNLVVSTDSVSQLYNLWLVETAREPGSEYKVVPTGTMWMMKAPMRTIKSFLNMHPDGAKRIVRELGELGQKRSILFSDRMGVKTIYLVELAR